MLALLLLSPVLIIDPISQQMDREIKIHVEQAAPFQKVELRGKLEGTQGDLWESWAEFEADEEGRVYVEQTAPLRGSYEGVDGMGLFWSMSALSENAPLVPAAGDQFPTEIELYADGQLVAHEVVSRYFTAPGIRRIEIREKGLVGTLFVPPSESPPPVIIWLGGSEGGIREGRAKLLASYGFATFSLGYFGAEGLPPWLQNIPLEYFETAFEWLKTQPSVDGSRIGLFGASRGGELSLILGSFFPDAILGIVAVVPSSIVNGAYAPRHAWIYHSLPIAAYDRFEGLGKDPLHPICHRSDFLKDLENQKATAAIPVEKIQCPIRLISGGDDQLWPSDVYSNQVMERLEALNSPIDRQHWHYPKAGHWIRFPHMASKGSIYYAPIDRVWFSVGGTKEEDQQASLDSWNKTIRFFQHVLGN